MLGTPTSCLSRRPGPAAVPWSSPAWWQDIPTPDSRTKEELAFVCLPRRAVGPGGPCKLPNVVVPMGPCRSCEARGATVHVACDRQRSAVPLMSPGGQEPDASMEGRDGGDLAEPASPPRLLTGAARPKMIQISMFILVMLSSAHYCGGVGVPPWEWDKCGKAVLPRLLAQPQQNCFWPGCGVPPASQHGWEHPGALPLWVLALSSSLHRLLLSGCLQAPPPPTLLSPLPLFTRKKPRGWSQ